MIFAPAHILIQLLCGYQCTSEEEDEETLDEDDLQLRSSSWFVSRFFLSILWLSIHFWSLAKRHKTSPTPSTVHRIMKVLYMYYQLNTHIQIHRLLMSGYPVVCSVYYSLYTMLHCVLLCIYKILHVLIGRRWSKQLPKQMKHNDEGLSFPLWT